MNASGLVGNDPREGGGLVRTAGAIRANLEPFGKPGVPVSLLVSSVLIRLDSGSRTHYVLPSTISPLDYSLYA